MKAVNNILVPVDFSRMSENALAYAIQLAKEINSKKLYIVHAFRLPATVTFTGYPYGVPYADQIMDTKTMEEEVKSNLEELEARLLQGTNLQYEFMMAYGFAEEVILETIADQKVDLVVMGTRGSNPVARFLGSTTVDIMTQCSCPVLAIPEKAGFSKIQKIAFAVDYKKVEKPETFEFLAILADTFHAEIDILHFDTKQKIMAEGIHVSDAIERSLHKVPHRYHYIVADNVNEGIEKFLETHEVGMVAMMPRPHSFLDRLRHGSETQKMLYHTQIPLLAFHA